MTRPINVLISLHKGYGLGDAVQMSAVLRHVVVARPEWHIDYQAEEGRHQVGRGIVNNTFAYGEKYPTPHYDAEVQICLYDTWSNWHDRPNTRVSSALHLLFGLPWNPAYGRYQVNITGDANKYAYDLLRHGVGSLPSPGYGHRVVAVHYEGDSSPTKKNLNTEQVDFVCRKIEQLKYQPLILDWRHRSLLHYTKLRYPKEYGGDAEKVCAIISQCAAFVGIDSGPSKCASATNTPALVVWTGHHPAPFHDPAPNTTHLVPLGYHGLEPVCHDPDVIRWFEANHNIMVYERDPVESIKQWLTKTLH